MILNLWFSYYLTPECDDASKVTEWVENLVETKIIGFLSDFSEITEDKTRRSINSGVEYTPHSLRIVGTTALLYFSTDDSNQCKIVQQVIDELSDIFDKLIFQEMSKHSDINSVNKSPNITVQSR